MAKQQKKAKEGNYVVNNPQITLDILSKKFTEYGRYIRYMDLKPKEKKALVKARNRIRQDFKAIKKQMAKQPSKIFIKMIYWIIEPIRKKRKQYHLWYWFNLIQKAKDKGVILIPKKSKSF